MEGVASKWKELLRNGSSEEEDEATKNWRMILQEGEEFQKTLDTSMSQRFIYFF